MTEGLSHFKIKRNGWQVLKNRQIVFNNSVFSCFVEKDPINNPESIPGKTGSELVF